jgi:hypothetical protein
VQVSGFSCSICKTIADDKHSAMLRSKAHAPIITESEDALKIKGQPSMIILQAPGPIICLAAPQGGAGSSSRPNFTCSRIITTPKPKKFHDLFGIADALAETVRPNQYARCQDNRGTELSLKMGAQSATAKAPPAPRNLKSERRTHCACCASSLGN